MSTPTATTPATQTQPQLILYSKPDCGQCDQTKKLLNRAEIEYTIIDVTEDADALRHVTQKLGYVTAPVLEFLRPRMAPDHWYGFRPDKLKEAVLVLRAAQSR